MATPPPPTPPPTQPTPSPQAAAAVAASDSNTTRNIIIGAVAIMLIIGGVIFWFARGSGEDDFTAVSPEAQQLQQACFDSGLFYDEFGNCYDINPASIVAADRAAFVVQPGSSTAVTDEVTGETTQSGGSAGSTGQAAPGTSGGSGSTGQSNPSSSGGNTTTATGQNNPSSDDTTTSTGQSNPSGGDTTTDTTTSTDTTTTDTTTTDTTTDTTTTTEPTTAPTTTTEPTEAPITARTGNWSFTVSPTVPEGGCEQDARVDGVLPKECQDYQRAYGGQANYSCTMESTGKFTCKQTDGDRKGTIDGTVTRSSVSLWRSGKTLMTGNNAEDGKTPGVICKMSGSSTETVEDQNGVKGEVSGTWSARSNDPVC